MEMMMDEKIRPTLHLPGAKQAEAPKAACSAPTPSKPKGAPDEGDFFIRQAIADEVQCLFEYLSGDCVTGTPTAIGPYSIKILKDSGSTILLKHALRAFRRAVEGEQSQADARTILRQVIQENPDLSAAEAIKVATARGLIAAE
jgi:hypothetical protein